MDSVKLILTGPVPKPTPLSDPAKTPATDDGKKQAAKDFESLFIAQILEQMKETIPDSGLLEDATSKQMEGLFWLYLAQDIANKGGFGLWKDIYQTLTAASPLPAASETCLDGRRASATSNK